MKTIYKKLLFLLLLLPLSVLAQSSLNGVVLDSKSKQPIPGVNVIIQGSPNGTSTDFDGKFQLSKLKKGDKIVFTYLGYEKAIITFDSQKTVSISLKEESNQLQEVVVQTGYGSVKKKDATGSVALLTSKDFNKGAIVSTDQLLTGKVAGVRITTDGGSPDSAPNIRIRGGASLSASNNPLIIIDGVAISNDNPAGVSNPLSLINPNDVESFSVLKDASATAIYGVRGSNGVIIITTKKGSTGAPQYTFSSSFSVGKIDKKIDVMSSSEFVKFIHEYYPSRSKDLGIPDGSGIPDNPVTPEVEGRIISDTNWQDQIYRTSISQDYNFSARANLYKKIPFRASVGYNNSQGLVKTNDYKRFSYSLKMTPKFLTDHLKVDINAKGTLTDKNAIDDGGSIGSAIVMDPTKPVYNNNSNKFGGYYQTTEPNGDLSGSSNPLAILEQRSRPERALRFLGNVEFDYKMHFLPELRAVLNLGLDASHSKIREVYSDNAIATYKFNQGTNPLTNHEFNPGLNYEEFQTVTNKTMDAYLAYTKNLSGFVTRVDAQAGYSYQDFKIDGNKSIYDYNSAGLRYLKFDAGNPSNRYYSPTNLQSFFARTNFDLKNKYLFTFTFRADASSYFKKENRWGYFPAAGFAWKMKEESFLKNSKFIQDLKLRLSIGKTGQNSISGNVGYFPSRPLFEIGSVSSQYLPGIQTYSAKPFNNNLTWEKTTTINAGLDFEFLKRSQLSGSFDVFRSKTVDLLSTYDLPPGQSLSPQFTGNIAETQSKGFELGLNIKAVQSDNFNLSFNGNVAYAYVKITDLHGLNQINSPGGGLPTQTGLQLAYNPIGFQAHSAWVFQQIYNTNGEPIVGAFVDLNGDGKINNDDRYFKSLRPNWTFGFGTTLNYKNWDLSANFRGQYGGQMYNTAILRIGNTEEAVPQNGISLNNVLNFYNGSANILDANFKGNDKYSDRMLEDATFVRCDNVTLGYKFNKFIKKSTLKVYTSVNNAFVLTKFKGQDPENYNGIDDKFYPRPRVYTFGVNLDF
jgi:TonB-dependent starch-binding outer membrane protein SusC